MLVTCSATTRHLRKLQKSIDGSKPSFAKTASRTLECDNDDDEDEMDNLGPDGTPITVPDPTEPLNPPDSDTGEFGMVDYDNTMEEDYFP